MNLFNIDISIIEHKTTEENPNAHQNPRRLSLNLNANKHPRGKAINQYPIILDISTTPVFFNPLKIPESETCKPSKTWKKHKT